ncbi:MAG TPA: hypothetical protein VNU97_05630 [Rhizomicrobium sp.]|jgi:hypothetical protein|nr:hypothetical protein [Rhizomicrobium sp.]
MNRRFFALLAATALALSGVPAAGKEPVPTRVGQCVTTTIKETGPRLEGIADSGSSVGYANGLFQVSYEVVPGIAAARAGDRVKLCLIEIPSDCPKGDDRGKVYKATDLRNHKSWQAPDSEHSCGGA